MTEQSFNTIDQALGDALRRFARGDDDPAVAAALAEAGVFLPIAETGETSGRARCRVCAGRIERGSPAVVFTLDLYIKRFGRWGHPTKSWIHLSCPTNGEEQR